MKVLKKKPHLKRVPLEESELKTEVEPELAGGPQVSEFVPLTGQLLQGGLGPML
jgi:hypothetical protein